jgi:hypothetical protein
MSRYVPRSSTNSNTPRHAIVEARGRASCAASKVSRDAWPSWDIGKQEWVLGSVFDYGHCDRCDGESGLIEVEIAPVST